MLRDTCRQACDDLDRALDDLRQVLGFDESIDDGHDYLKHCRYENRKQSRDTIDQGVHDGLDRGHQSLERVGLGETRDQSFDDLNRRFDELRQVVNYRLHYLREDGLNDTCKLCDVSIRVKQCLRELSQKVDACARQSSQRRKQDGAQSSLCRRGSVVESLHVVVELTERINELIVHYIPGFVCLLCICSHPLRACLDERVQIHRGLAEQIHRESIALGLVRYVAQSVDDFPVDLFRISQSSVGVGDGDAECRISFSRRRRTVTRGVHHVDVLRHGARHGIE